MLARLVLALLLAAFSLPAMAGAPCHDGMAMAAMTMPAASATHPAPKPAPAVMHDCIGCVPPTSLRGARVLAPPLVAAVRPVPLPVAFTRHASVAPATPPPRI